MLLVDHHIRDLCRCDPVVDSLFSNRGVSWPDGWSSRSPESVSRGIHEYQLPKPMIQPFSEAVSGNGVISYGLTHAGYDLRLDGKVLVFKNSYNEVIDPKLFGDEAYRRRVFDELEVSVGQAIVIPPHGYILGRSLEYLRIPPFLKGRCVGKSTLARSGILINTTPLEPGWEGHLTIEIGNITPCPARVYCGEGVAQLEFETLSATPEKDYGAKDGKYQGQVAVTPALVR